MGFIYKITNLINKKVYIGQTVNTVEQRFIEHKSQYKAGRYSSSRPLYNAFEKYGIDNFIIEEIEQIPNDLLNEREKYWIKYYNSYYEGYNATLGGDTTILYDYDEIIKLYEEYKNCSKVAELIGCRYTTVSRVLRANGFEIKKPNINKRSRRIKLIEKNLIFNSLAEAARYLQENFYTTNLNSSCISGKIKMVCDKKRNTAYGFQWTYAD